MPEMDQLANYMTDSDSLVWRFGLSIHTLTRKLAGQFTKCSISDVSNIQIISVFFDMITPGVFI